jgi:hypothetical protein
MNFLEVTVPVILREAPFLDFVSKFLKSYPCINVDLFRSDGIRSDDYERRP